MKKLSLVLLSSLPIFLFAQNTFSISGNVRGVEPNVDKVYIFYAANGQNVIDSAIVVGNRYRFEGVINAPTRIDLRAAYKAKDEVKASMSRDMITFFADPSSIDIRSVDSFSNASITGSESNIAFQELQKAAKPYMTKVANLMRDAAKYKQAHNAAALAATESRLDDIQAQMKENVYADFINKQPRSPLAFFALQQYTGAIIRNVGKAEALFDKLPQGVQHSRDGQRMKFLIDMTKRTAIGSKAPAFTQADAQGNPVTLAEFKGKYVLVNFWASWCGPCRAQNPEWVKIYQQYKNDGFAMISVSMDKPGEKDNWLQAVKDDGLTWPQVSDLRFWNNEVAVKYGVVAALPQNFLIDRNGVIIAKNLRPSQVAEKLKNIFN